MTKLEMTEAMIAAKAAKKASWGEIAAAVGLSDVFTTSVCLLLPYDISTSFLPNACCPNQIDLSQSSQVLLYTTGKLRIEPEPLESNWSEPELV